MYYTYIIKSLSDNRYYYGSSNDINRRLVEHNCGKVKATKNRLPFVLHHSEAFKTQIEALRRERFFKRRSGHKWLKDNRII